MFFLDMINDAMCHEDYSKKGEYAPQMRGSRPSLDPRARMEGNSGAFGSSYASPSAGGQHRQGGQQNPRTRGTGNDSGNYGAWSSKQPPNSKPNGSPPPGNGRGPNMSRATQGTVNERGDDFASRTNVAKQNPGKAAPKPKQAPNRRGQQDNRKDTETRDTTDTVIGRGFTAAMKRGVAQAKPKRAREELQQQKDGGFISTIQRGFEGLFGKPTSKEEVLRQRGPVFANEYEAVPGDEVDRSVQFFARRLPEDVAGCLKIFREAKGEYQINDEIVHMELKYRQAPTGETEKEIFVFWDTDNGEQSDPEPLSLFLSHAANVAFEVKQGGNAITQVPDHARMSFHDEIGTKLTDDSADARFNAMEVAARQAKLREEAAREWRENQNKPKMGRPPAESPSQAFESPRAHHDAKEYPEEEVSIADRSLQAKGVGQAPPCSYAAPCAAPNPAFRNLPPQPMNMPAVNAPPVGFMMPHAIPRQGTMYAYGSSAPMAGYPTMAPMQQLRPSHASMYSTCSAYGVPVR